MTTPATTAAAIADDQHVGHESCAGSKRKSPAGQMPASCKGLSGRTRFASGSNETMFECRKSRTVRMRRQRQHGDEAGEGAAGAKRRRGGLGRGRSRRREEERRSDPGRGAGVQHAEEERGHDRERQQVPEPLRPHGERHDRGEQRHGPRGAELLDPAPERVAVEQRRLRGHEAPRTRAAAASGSVARTSSYSASASIAAITAIVGW